MAKGPVLIELETAAEQGPEVAPVVPDLMVQEPQGQAMMTVASLAARPPNRLARWFWTVLGLLISTAVSIAAWDFVTGLLARSPILGTIVGVLAAVFVLLLLAITVRELAGFSRLRRIDGLRRAANEALQSHDVKAAQSVTAKMIALYKARDDTRWGRDAFETQRGDAVDADTLLVMAETTILRPLDAAAQTEVEAAVRQVATVTALVPLALADVATALMSNMRMIRRIAEIYGGRAGTLGSFRLMRAVLTHLVATGAVAVGDDLIGSVAGGGVIGKVSRRFGEGVVNGALTARVGVAAMDVCRPLPFIQTKRPSVTKIVQRALTGFFSK